jgi:hypothetical protein
MKKNFLKSQHSIQQKALYCSRMFYITLPRWTLLHVSIPCGIIIRESHYSNNYKIKLHLLDSLLWIDYVNNARNEQYKIENFLLIIH